MCISTVTAKTSLVTEHLQASSRLVQWSCTTVIRWVSFKKKKKNSQSMKLDFVNPPLSDLNLPLILSNFECLYLARWGKVGWVWGAKLLYRPPTKSTSSFKPLISPDQPEMVKSLWRVIQNLIRVWYLQLLWYCSNEVPLFETILNCEVANLSYLCPSV